MKSVESILIIHSDQQITERIAELVQKSQPDCQIRKREHIPIYGEIQENGHHLWIIGSDQFFNTSGVYSLPFYSDKILLIDSTDHCFAHEGSHPKILSPVAKDFDTKIAEWISQSINTTEGDCKLFHLKFGHTSHWFSSEEILSVQKIEGISIIHLLNGVQLPLRESIEEIGKMLNHQEFHIDTQNIRRVELTPLKPETLSTVSNSFLSNLCSIPSLLKWAGVLIFLLGTIFSMGQNIELKTKEAISLSQNGQFELADNIFQSIDIATLPDPFQYYLSRAYNYSWWKKFDQANEYFNKAIALHSESIEAISGLAFNHSWKGNYSMATSYFNKVLFLQPYNYAALKGLTLNYLNGNNLDGAQYFGKQLNQLYPDESDTHYLYGLVQLKQLNTKQARKFFQQAVKLDPNHISSKEELAKLGTKPTRISLSAWYGFSTNDGIQRDGLRRLDAKYQFNKDLMVYGYFDNSLILDNSFIDRDKIASLLSAGVKYHFSDQYFARLEMGSRYFKDQENQLLISGEQVFFVSSRIILKNILQVDWRDNKPHGLISGGLDVALTNFLRIEGTYFLTKSFEDLLFKNERWVIGPKININSFELVTGAYYDRLTNLEISKRQWSGYYFLARLGVLRNFEMHFLYNYDIGLFDNSARVVALGLTYKL